jgi:hypothetical protein
VQHRSGRTNGANGGQRIIGGVFDNEDKTYPIVESAATNPVRFEGTEIRVPNASVVLATGGGGATYDDRTRVVYTKVRPVLKTADSSPQCQSRSWAYGYSTATTPDR